MPQGLAAAGYTLPVENAGLLRVPTSGFAKSTGDSMALPFPYALRPAERMIALMIVVRKALVMVKFVVACFQLSAKIFPGY